MIVNDKVDIVGMGITPTALGYRPAGDRGEDPTLVMSSGASITTTKSPYMVRAGFILAQPVRDHGRMGIQEQQQARRHAGQRLGARHRGRNRIQDGLHRSVGGEIIESIRIPLANPDFAPFLQRIRDLKPDTAFIYFPGTQAAIFAKQFAERGLGKSGIKIIGPGDLTTDDELNNMGDQMLGMITAGDYSASHDSALNKEYVAAFKKDGHNFRPDFVSLGAYDGFHLLYEALKKTGGKTDGEP